MSSTDITKAAKDYRELQAMIKDLEAEADAIKARITAEMEARQTDTLQADVFTIKWTVYTSSRLDTAAIKKELPDVAARYTKTAEARRFQVA
jgi:predicted phage-related endonuclease